MTAEPPVVFLARHGQTELNAAGVLRGRLDPPLDQVGRRQAAALARTFEDTHLALVVSSPLKRALQTAEPICQATGAELLVDERLADRDYGPWAGRSLSELLDRHHSVDQAPGVETGLAVARRVVPAFNDAVAAAAGDPVMLVAHDAVNRILLRPDGLRVVTEADIPQPVGCWNRLECDGDTWVATVIRSQPDIGI
jgi:broad specificity phosphatase PhoE